MKFSTMALFFGGAVVIGGAGIGAVACSSGGTGTPTPATNPDTGTDTGVMPGVDSSMPVVDGGSGTDTGIMMGSDAGDGGAACLYPPRLFPSNDAGTLRCPFGPGDGGSPAPIFCSIPNMEVCCISGKIPMDGGDAGYAASTCESNAGAGGGCAQVKSGVRGATQIQCEDPADCPANNVCCATAGATGGLKPDKNGCPWDDLVGWQTSKCATSCAAMEVQICTSDPQCSAGKTCTAFKAKGLDLGYCK